MKRTEFLITSENDDHQEHKGVAYLLGTDVLVINADGREFESPMPYELRINLKEPSGSTFEYRDSKGSAVIQELTVFPPDESGIQDIECWWVEDGVRWFIEGELPSPE